MAVAQGGSGKIEIFEDFVGAEWIIAETAASGKIGSLRLIGDGIAETDSGAVSVESGGLSGVIRLTTTNEDKHGVYIATPLMFDAALMGTLVLEARIRVEAVANREIFVGFSDVNADDLSLEDDLVHGGTATITLTASDICGFLVSSELSDSTDWHTVYNGGTTTGETTSTNLDVGDVIAADVWQILRVEVAPNGTAFFYIDGVAVGGSDSAKSNGVSGAMATGVDVAAIIGVESKTTTALTLDVDYVKIMANRDWTTTD